MTEVECRSYLIKESYNRIKKTDCTETSDGTCLVFEFAFYLSLLLHSLNPQIFFSIIVIFSVPAFSLGVSNVSCEPEQWRQTLLLGVWWRNCQPLQVPVQILYELQLSTRTHGDTHTAPPPVMCWTKWGLWTRREITQFWQQLLLWVPRLLSSSCLTHSLTVRVWKRSHQVLRRYNGQQIQ